MPFPRNPIRTPDSFEDPQPGTSTFICSAGTGYYDLPFHAFRQSRRRGKDILLFPGLRKRAGGAENSNSVPEGFLSFCGRKDPYMDDPYVLSFRLVRSSRVTIRGVVVPKGTLWKKFCSSYDGLAVTIEVGLYYLVGI